MSNAIELNHLWKKFNRGEFNDCLRDAIPAWFNRLIGRGPKRDELTQKEFWALKDLDFKIEEGETVGFIGHNGAGKSTLLKILSNILEPTRGSMRVKGKLRSLIEIGSGFHGDLTGRENIYLNGAILGMTHREIEKNFDSIVDFSGVEEFLDMPVKRYSSGMFARLGFAVAAHLEPDVLIVDEVLSVGDTAFQKKCLGKMSDVAQSGRTVLFVSHNMQAVRNLCNRTLLLEHGAIIGDGPTEDILFLYYERLKGDLIKREQKVRSGQQDIKFTKVLAGLSVDDLSEDDVYCDCNGPLVIRLFFEVNKPLDNILLAVTFRDQYENHRLACTTGITKPALETISHSGYIDFTIPHLPLGKGIYSLSAWIHQNFMTAQSIEMDLIENSLNVHVNLKDDSDWQLSKGYIWDCFTPYSWNITNIQ